METRLECRNSPKVLRRSSYLAVLEERVARERLVGWKGVAMRSAKHFSRGRYCPAGSKTKRR